METLNAALLNETHGAIISPDAHVEVPAGWYLAVDSMLAQIADLPTDIRAFLIIVGIYPSDNTGLLIVDIGANTDLMVPGGIDQVGAIVKGCRDLCAWSCVNDGEHGWLVHSKSGPRALCPECQSNAGLEVKCHAV